MQEQNGQATFQLSQFAAAHTFYLLGDMFDIRFRQIARTQQFSLPVCPGTKILLVINIVFHSKDLSHLDTLIPAFSRREKE